MNQLKALVAALVGVLAPFAEQFAEGRDVNWRTVVVALIVMIAAHQGVYWTTNRKTPAD